MPQGAGSHRLWRSNTLSEYLASRGHQVVRWRSSFDHYKKRPLASGGERIDIGPYAIQFLPAPQYRRNIGIARWRHHRALAESFRQFAPREMLQPDVIHVANVPLELCREVVTFAVARRVPVIVDVRDLWPDVVIDMAPASCRFFARSAFHRMTEDSRYSLRNATAISGISDPIVEWGANQAGRVRSKWDRSFPMAYADLSVGVQESGEADGSTVASLGIMPDDFLVCFFGSIGHQFDFDTVLDAAVNAQKFPHIKFVLCGDGPVLATLRRRAAGLPNVILPGWLEGPDIRALMRVAAVGILPYRPYRCFKMSISSKFSEYLAGGLAIACGVEGEMAALTITNRCGFVYAHGDWRSLLRGLAMLAAEGPALSAAKHRARALFGTQFSSAAIYPDMCEYLELIHHRVT